MLYFYLFESERPDVTFHREMKRLPAERVCLTILIHHLFASFFLFAVAVIVIPSVRTSGGLSHISSSVCADGLLCSQWVFL